MKSKKTPADFIIKKSTLPFSGKGLFTKQLIKRGAKIVEYKGKLTTWKDADHDDGRNFYIYYIDRNYVIDARPYKKMLARYVNDAKGLRKNPDIKNNSTYIIKKTKVFIKAMKDIPAGNEIFAGYGKEYWTVIKENKRKKK